MEQKSEIYKLLRDKVFLASKNNPPDYNISIMDIVRLNVEAFNLGVQMSADNAETYEEPYTYCQECMNGSRYVDKKSILKLLIK